MINFENENVLEKINFKRFVYHLYNFVQFSHTVCFSFLYSVRLFPFDSFFSLLRFGFAHFFWMENLQPPSVDSRLGIRRIIILNE